MFNHHRLKRKWGRGVKKASNLVYMRSNDKILKDFAWHRRKNNPFWRNEDDKLNWKKIVELTFLTICLLAMMLLAIFAPTFRINSIQISGLQRIKYAEVEDSIKSVLNYHRLLIFPGDNYFLADLDEIKDILKQKFSLNSIIIKKEFPNKLFVGVEEKISTVIYDNGLEYSYLDIGGHLVEVLKKVGPDEWLEDKKTVTSTDATGKEISEVKITRREHLPNIKGLISEFGDYPVIFDERQVSTTVGTIVLEKEIVQGVIEWFNKLNSLNSATNYFTIKDGLGEVTIKMGEGWIIKADTKNDISNRFNELQYLLKNKIKTKKINYIDLRFPGKAYWK